MNLLNWLKSLGSADRTTAADIRRRLLDVQRQHAATIQRRGAMAFDAVRDEGAAERWQALDDAARSLLRQIDVLTDALPQAEARDAEVTRQQEVARHEQSMLDCTALIQEAEVAFAAIVATLPTGEQLTALRDLRDRIAGEARAIRTSGSRWANDARVRRPLDPLGEVLDAMQHRIDRVARSRWAPSHPITLGTAEQREAIAQAKERVGAGGTHA